MIRHGMWGVVAILVGSMPWSGAHAAALMPHRALYTMELISASDSAEVVDVQGNLAADWSETCEGWSQEFSLYFDISYEGNGATVRIQTTAATWESRDGKSFVFTVRNDTTGEATELIEGQATLGSRGKPGEVTFTSPKPETLRLPEGTIFPTEHSIKILEAAVRAPAIVSHLVFDGLTVEGPVEITSVIGKRAAADRAPASDHPALKNRTSWPLNMAFFKANDKSLAPDREQSMRIYDNGVGDDLVLDFGDFRVRAKLERLEMRKQPNCQ